MAGKPIRMSQLKQLILLKQSGHGIKSIARELGISKNTVKNYIFLIDSGGMTAETMLSMDDPILEGTILVGNPSYKKEERYRELTHDMERYFLDLKKPGVSKQLLWQEYRESNPKGYGYSQFCFHLGQHQKASKPSMVLHHEAGDKLFIDFAGKKLSYIDIETGEIIECQVFVACLPYSDYGFALAVRTQSIADFIYALEQCLYALGGVPQTIVPDNLKSAVIKANKYEPELNQVLEDFANHYRTTVTPTRAARPQDKALVENHVKLVYGRVYAKLRNRQFFDLPSLNAAISEKMLDHNQTRMQQKPFCREERFLADEKPLLKPLAAESFEIKTYKTLTVAKNNHVYFTTEKHYYSVPYAHIGKKTTVIITRSLVKIYVENMQVACHIRIPKYGYSTAPEHLCSTHKHYNDRSPEYYQSRAKSHSPELYRLVLQVFRQSKHPEQKYRTCDGLLSLSRKTETNQFIAACNIAMEYDNFSYLFLKNIIDNRMTEILAPLPESKKKLPEHRNIRGRECYK
jgi:transposase